jgi:hypothetical protein
MTKKIRIVVASIAAAIILAPVSGFSQGAQELEQFNQAESREFGHGTKIEGVWNSQVTIRDCTTGQGLKLFRGLGMFIRGGSLLQTNNTPNAPTTSGPSFGKWEHAGGQNYKATFQFFRFNPDGSFAGTQKVTRAIRLSADANQFTSNISFQVFDANDRLLQSGCGTETATRAQ